MLPKSGRFLAENIRLTYWYVGEPTTPRTLSYSKKQHQKNWAELIRLAIEMGSPALAHDEALTAAMAHCSNCPHCVYYGSKGSETAVLPATNANDEPEDDWLPRLEPHTP